MSKTKKPIIVYRNGAPIGYIKSVSYSRQKFFITQDINEAKGYTSVDLFSDYMFFPCHNFSQILHIHHQAYPSSL